MTAAALLLGMVAGGYLVYSMVEHESYWKGQLFSKPDEEKEDV